MRRRTIDPQHRAVVSSRLAGVLLFNVITHGSRQIQVAAVPRVAVDEQAAAARLAEAIRFQTISNFLNPDSRRRCVARLAGAYRQAVFRRFMPRRSARSSASYSLLYTWEGSDPKAAPIALLAHQDVVPVSPGTDEGLAAAAVRRRHRRWLYLGPRLVGRQGQSLFDAGSRRANDEGGLSPETNDLFRLRPR